MQTSPRELERVQQAQLSSRLREARAIDGRSTACGSGAGACVARRNLGVDKTGISLKPKPRQRPACPAEAAEASKGAKDASAGSSRRKRLQELGLGLWALGSLRPQQLPGVGLSGNSALAMSSNFCASSFRKSQPAPAEAARHKLDNAI